MRVLLRLLSYLISVHWLVLCAIGLGLLTIASNIGLMAFSGYLISDAAIVPLLLFLTIPIYIVRFTGISRAIARYGERLCSHNLTFRLLARIRSWFYGRLEPLAPAQIQAYRSGDLLARLVGDIGELQNIYLRIVGPITVAILTICLTCYTFSLFHASLVWIALAFLLGAGLGIPALSHWLTRGWGERQLVQRAALKAQSVDALQGLPDLLVFGQVARQQSRVHALDDALGRIQRRMALVSGTHQMLNELLANLAAWTVLLLAIPLVLARGIDGSYLAFLVLFILASFEAIQPLGEAFQFLDHSQAAGSRLFKLVDARPLVAEPEAARPFPSSSAGCTLTFEHVDFSYDTAESAEGANNKTLHDISLTLRPGQRIAVVGPSGAGKSTLVRLLLRFWDPTAGTISINGVDIRSLALDDLRAQLGIVTQDTYLFGATLRENLLLAKKNASDEEIARVLQRARLDECVAHLPSGLDTWIGEQGHSLSGGERQRVAIARTLLKQAPILILDEVTANLDPQTEQEVLDALDELMQRRTTLLITHRLLRMELMDEILVLDRGRIVERGSHQDLLQRRGLYNELFTQQRSLLDFI